MTLETLAERVEAQGYGIIPSVLAPGEILSLLETVASSSVIRSRAGVRHALSQPRISRIANDPRLLGIAGAICGRDVIPFRATVFDKSLGSNWLVVWHQDTALPLRNRHEKPGWGPWSVKAGVTYAHAPAEVLEKVVALRLHLDDSNIENGPLRVIPGTHKTGVLSEVAIEERVVRGVRIECLAPSGSVVAMRPLILHSSSKSRGTLPRRVLHIEYASEELATAGIEFARA